MKDLIKIACLAILFPVCPLSSDAQDLTLLSSGGGFTSAGDTHLAYSIGEPLIGYEQSGSTWLTQGFQQPGHVDLMVSADGESSRLPVTIYPNPATTTLTLDGMQTGECHSLVLTSLLGQQALIITEPEGRKAINIESLQPGWYILTLHCNETQYRSSSIIKL